MSHDCPCCTCEEEEETRTPYVREPNPVHPTRGTEMSDEEWIRLSGLRKRAEKVGMALPRKWMVPHPPMMFAMNYVMKSVYLPAIREHFNSSSILFRHLERAA